MKLGIVAVVLLLVSTSLARQKKQATDCSQANTQAEMTRCAGDDARLAETEMQRVFSQLVQKANGNPQLLVAVKASQQTWLMYRTAQLHAIFPLNDKQAEYGSRMPMCKDAIYAEMTRRRTAELRRMVQHWSDSGPGCEF